MPHGLKMTLGGLELGLVQLIDLDGFADKGDNPMINPLTYAAKGAPPILRYRNPNYVPEGSQSAYEISLGMVIAATVIVYSSAHVQTPASVAMALLMRDPSRADEADEGLRALIVEPARNGDEYAAHSVDEVKVAAVKKAVREGPGLELAVLPENPPTDLAELVKYLFTSQFLMDLDLPVQMVGDGPLTPTLPDSLLADADGRFYLRDVLNGEADFLFEGQDAFGDLHIQIKAEGGYFILLEEGEELINHRLVEENVEQTSISSRSTGDIEHFLSRLVVQLDGEERAEITISTYSQDDLLFEQIINIARLEDFDEILEEEDDILLAADSALQTEALPEGRAESNVLVEEHILDDIFDNAPEIL